MFTGFPAHLSNGLPHLMHLIAAMQYDQGQPHIFSNYGYGFVGHRHKNLDALYGPSFNLQRKPMAPIAAADSSRSFTIEFTHDEQQSVIKKMINMNLISDSETKELSPHHVQLLYTMFANKKKCLECFHETNKKQEKYIAKTILSTAATHDEIIAVDEAGELHEEAEIMKTIARSNLADRVKRRHLTTTARYMSKQALPVLRKCVHAMDDDGAQLSDNFLMSEVLRYGVRDANQKNLISPALSFPEMLPNYVVDAITALARGEQEAEEKRKMRFEALPDWLEIYHKPESGAQVFRLLRRIVQDRMIPSMYQLDHFKETLAQEYRPTITWHQTYSGFQIKAAEFLPVYILSNLLCYVAGYDTGLLDHFWVVLKCLVDGFHLNQLNCVHALAFHMNLILLPLDAALAMTDFYPTDQEMRARNPAGQRGISTATMAATPHICSLPVMHICLCQQPNVLTD
jgi:hypothetical protein